MTRVQTCTALLQHYIAWKTKSKSAGTSREIKAKIGCYTLVQHDKGTATAVFEAVREVRLQTLDLAMCITPDLFKKQRAISQNWL